MTTATVICACVMQGLDTTIVNVCLPHIQGSMSAAQDQISCLTRSNRRGTDPYARWCGRGGAVRCPPIPIFAGKRSFASAGANGEVTADPALISVIQMSEPRGFTPRGSREADASGPMALRGHQRPHHIVFFVLQDVAMPPYSLPPVRGLAGTVKGTLGRSKRMIRRVTVPGKCITVSFQPISFGSAGVAGPVKFTLPWVFPRLETWKG